MYGNAHRTQQARFVPDLGFDLGFARGIQFQGQGMRLIHWICRTSCLGHLSREPGVQLCGQTTFRGRSRDVVVFMKKGSNMEPDML